MFNFLACGNPIAKETNPRFRRNHLKHIGLWLQPSGQHAQRTVSKGVSEGSGNEFAELHSSQEVALPKFVSLMEGVQKETETIKLPIESPLHIR
jgi:hypothetical protein